MATFFSCFTKAFTMWLARSAPRETRCASVLLLRVGV